MFHTLAASSFPFCMANSLNFVFSRTASSTPSQSAPRGSRAVSDRERQVHAMSSPSGGYRAISTARPPPTLSHVGENSVPTFGHENGDLLPTPTQGSGGRARRRTRLEIYGSVPTRRTSEELSLRRRSLSSDFPTRTSPPPKKLSLSKRLMTDSRVVSASQRRRSGTD